MLFSCQVMSSSFVTPWTIACQTPLSMWFPRQEDWSGLPFPSAGNLPYSGTEPGSPELQADSLLSEPPGEPICMSGKIEAEIETYHVYEFKIQYDKEANCPKFISHYKVILFDIQPNILSKFVSFPWNFYVQNQNN